MAIWHIVSLSFNECLVSLMTSKCVSLVLGLKRNVLCFTSHSPTASNVAIKLLYASPLPHLGARLNYPTTFAHLLTAALAGVSFPDVHSLSLSHSPDGKLVSAASHQLKRLTPSTTVPFY